MTGSPLWKAGAAALSLEMRQWEDPAFSGFLFVPSTEPDRRGAWIKCRHPRCLVGLTPYLCSSPHPHCSVSLVEGPAAAAAATTKGRGWGSEGQVPQGQRWQRSVHQKSQETLPQGGEVCAPPDSL